MQFIQNGIGHMRYHVTKRHQTLVEQVEIPPLFIDTLHSLAVIIIHIMSQKKLHDFLMLDIAWYPLFDSKKKYYRS